MRRHDDAVRPPRLARRLLVLLAGPDDPERVVSTLAELYARRVERDGAAAARRWYVRQVAGVALRHRSLRREARPLRGAAASWARAGGPSLDALLRGLKEAARSLIRQPGFTLVAVATLALGIGANTAIFSVVRAVVLRPLPYPDASSLVVVWPEMVTNVRAMEWLAERTRSFERVAGYSAAEFSLTGDGQAERLGGARVTPGLFDVLDVRPALGRGFLAEESEPGRSRVVILSDALWRTRYASDPAIVGRTVRLDFEPYTVVGVMPRAFRPLEPTQRLWVPQEVEPGTTVATDGTWWLRTRVARLAPGVSTDAAQRELRAAALRLADDFPADVDRAQAGRATVATLQDATVGEFRRTLWILLAGVGLVLLVACGNVANLLLARAGARQREVAVRTAIGAGRGQVVGHLLAESLLLGVVGAAAGVALSRALLPVLIRAAPADLPRLDEVAVDEAVLSFALALALLTPVVFGLAPAFRATRTELRDVLATGGRGFVGGQRRRLASALIAGQVALSLVLVIAAGLMMRTVRALQSVDPGFDPHGLLTLHIAIPPGDDAPPDVAYAQLWSALRAIPGVDAVGGIHILPLTPGNNRYPFWAQDNEPDAGRVAPAANIRVATPGYLEAMRIDLRAGRWFTDADRADGRPVLALNEALARRLWPEGDAVGKRIRLLDPSSDAWEVVGIIADTRQMEIASEASGEIYLPHPQWPWPSMYATIRTAGDPAALAPAVRSTIRAIDADITLARVATMEQVMATSLASTRFVAVLTGAFGLLALTLAAIGIYGVVAYVVARRVPEFGVRIALGSSTGRVLRVAMAHGLRPVAAGVALGLPAAWAATRFLASLLFGIAPTDPATFATAAAILLGVAAAATYLPARRAAAVDPTTALRRE